MKYHSDFPLFKDAAFILFPFNELLKYFFTCITPQNPKECTNPIYTSHLKTKYKKVSPAQAAIQKSMDPLDRRTKHSNKLSSCGIFWQ